MSVLGVLLGRGTAGKFAKAGYWLAGGQMAASYLHGKAEESTDPFMRTALNVGALAATYKSFQGPAANIAKGVHMGIRGSFLNRVAAAESAASGSASILQHELPSWYLGSRSAAKSLSGFGMTGLAGKVGGLMGKGAIHAPGLAISPITGTLEYGAAAARSLGGGPGSFMAAVSRIRSPEAPFVAAGLGLGLWTAHQNSISSHRGPVAAPSAMAYGWNSTLPINSQNFGGGISMGRSAIRSATVMDGQAAVTNRMLQKRRV